MEVILKEQFIIDGSVVGLDAKQPKERQGSYSSNLKKFKPDPDAKNNPLFMDDAYRPYLPSTAKVVRILATENKREGREAAYETIHIGPRFYESQSAVEFLDQWEEAYSKINSGEEMSELAQLKAQRKEDKKIQALRSEATYRAGVQPGGNLSRAGERYDLGDEIVVQAPKRSVGRPRKASVEATK